MKKILICPRCNSRNIRFQRSTIGGVISIPLGIFPAKYECQNCGFSGFLFPKVNSDRIDKIKVKKLRRRS